MKHRTDHETHAARMQAILESKAADAALALAVKHARNLPPEAAAARIDPFAKAAQRAAERLQALPLPAGPITYIASTRAPKHATTITVEPSASIQAIIRAAKTALGINNLPTEPPTSAITARWTLRIRGTNPADYLTIAAGPPSPTRHLDQCPAVIVPPEDALTALHTTIAQREAPTLTARLDVDDRRHALLAAYPADARAAYLVRPTSPHDAAPVPMVLPLDTPRGKIAREALRLLSLDSNARLHLSPIGAALTLTGGRIAAYITPDPDGEDGDEDTDDLETDERGNYIL